tara:strand:+ start:128 stop:430 length:303 start_codon:yes stop_codon:yes gene_type:complete
MNELKKNCHNCKHGSYQTEGDFGEYSWFECEKRFDDGKNNLDENLQNTIYLEKAKVCCDPMVLVTCIYCGEVGKAQKVNDKFSCFPCWIKRRRDKEQCQT